MEGPQFPGVPAEGTPVPTAAGGGPDRGFVGTAGCASHGSTGRSLSLPQGRLHPCCVGLSEACRLFDHKRLTVFRMFYF